MWFFSLNHEKYKTKSVTASLNCTSVRWSEQFNFHLFEDQSHLLEIILCDKAARDDSLARYQSQF